METVVGTGVTKVTEPLVDSVLRQIGYIWNYQDNLQSLRAQVQNLKGEMQVLKHDMENARQKGEQIEDVVKNWLKDANEKIEASEKILEDNDRANHFCFMGCCPNMKTRHQLSRKANKKTQVLVEVQKNRKFDKISYRTALKGIGPPKDYEAFESRMLILNQMLEALKDVDVTMIGVYGMGGVGKTTLAKKLAKQVEEDGIFKVVVIATVTSNVDLKRIQQEIAEWLRFPLEAEVTAVRAALLCSRLKQEEKILVILDEVWAQMKLEDIGIPLGTEHKGCKILMTSRNLNVLHEMGTERTFKLQVLEDEEARQLFEKKVGTLKHSLIKPMTNEVAKRCAGLPISIVAVATALKNKGLEEWKDALERLKRSGEDDMDKQVHSCFDLSYRYLENDEIKSLLRLSAYLFLSDRVDQLLKYVLGLSLFEGCRNLEETRNRLHKYVNDLKSSCLLLEGQRDGEVKMHDVVRSFAISTASRDHHVFTVAYDKVLEWPPKSKLEQCTAISLYFTEIPELPTTLECQQLQSFLLVYPGLGLSLRIPDDLFTMTTELKVLDLTGISLLSLPLSIQILENLQTLCLDDCKLEDISIIGKLKKLQVLSLMSSDIVRLPRELEQLTHLRLLDLSNCSSLEVIPRNVLSKLVRLEDLRMGNSFVQWEGEKQGGVGKNASLSELKALSNLVALDIHILDANILPRDLFSEKLERFRIFIGDGWNWSKDMYATSKVLKLKLNTSVNLEEIKVLLKTTEHLHLDELNGVKNILHELDEKGFPYSKKLYVQNSLDIEHIIDWRRMNHFIAFPKLESLFLQNLKKLEKIYHGRYVMGSFSNLRELKVRNCNVLKNLFSFSMLKGLVVLEKINVSRCEILKEIVAMETREDSEIKLPQLRKLKLEHLPQLTCFCSQGDVPSISQKPATASTSSGEVILEDESATLSLLSSKKIQFPNLVDLKLASINVEQIWPNQLTELSPWITNLTRLIIDTCENLSYLFTSSMVESLAKLIHIEIRDCKSMKEVIVTNREEMKSIMLFPRLDSIKLKGLPSLRRFCTAKFIECPSLKHLRIKNCPQLQAFISSSRSTYAGTSGQANSTLFDEKILFPNLENLRITNMHTLKMIWNDELCVDSFYRLKVLEVEHGKELLKVFPSKQLLRFKNLERLMVKDCNLVEEVFDLQVLMKIQEETDVAATTQTQLRYLIARELPNLKNVWNGDPSGILSFHNLQNVHAWDCPNLKELFPFSIAQSLPQLELLNIDGCGMEEIVAKEERAEATPKFTFGRLKSLYLWRLNGLKSFYSENHILECPQLEKLSVYGCDKLEIFTSEPGDLQTMDLEKQETQLKIQVPQPFFSFRKIIPNLKHLSLGNKDTSTIRQGQFPAHKLEFLELSCFLDGSTDSAFGLIHKFPNIKKLTLATSSFKVLFQHSILGEAEGALARLQFLKLENLPHMSHIWSEDCPPDHVFQNLEALEVWVCPSLIILAPSTASFQNLSTLDVWHCDQLVNLVASSTANSMVNLTKLTVRDSNMLKEIVANEGNEYQSHSQPQIILSKLLTLELCGLKNLTSFCSIASCTFKFPSLNDVVVAQCPNMKIFSQGVITSPELKRVYQTQDRDKWLWIGDLNTTIKQLYEEMVGFSGLQHLKLSEFPRLKQIWHDQLPVQLFCNLNTLVIDDCRFTFSSVPSNLIPFLGKLEELEVRNCDAVERIFGLEWLNLSGFVGHFSKLTSLTVHGCGNLKYLLSSSMIKSIVHLQRIDICDCKKMEQVIVGDGSEEETRMLLRELGFLKLGGLPKLTRFCTCDLIECPALNELQIINCPVLMTFVSSSASAVMAASSEREILDYTLFNEKVAFPNLVQVQISNADALRKIWHNHLHSVSFYKLRVMKVEYGNQLVQIFPSNIFKRLENLKDVVIRNCDSLEVVFDLQELVINITESITSELRDLDIRNLQNLKYVWNKDPQQALSFPNLSSVHVWHCPSLKNLFPTSIAKNLLQLKTLYLDDCGLKELVTKEEGVETNPKFAFPQLKSLDLWRLNELNCFYPGSHTLECPVLEKLVVFHCDKLETLTFEPVDSNLQETQMENPLFSFREIINNLEHLSLTRKDATTICQGQFPEDLFHMLKVIEINCYHDESAVFPFDLLERFHSMEKLAVKCSQFKELFPHEGHVGKEKYVKIVEKIRHLELDGLANLEHIWNQDSQLDKVLQSLEILDVSGCDSLITLAPSSASFQNLTTMDVKSFKVLASLTTSSTAKSLVQLTRLSVRECDMLIEIVASEGNDGSREEIIFNKLESLELLSLPSLVTFCAAEQSFKFPSLTLVIVEQCPKMQVFSNGVLSTPKLQTLRVTEEQEDEGRWNGNLNATIQQLFTEMNAEEDQSPSIEC